MIGSPATPGGELQFDLSAEDQSVFLAEVNELLELIEESLIDLERAPGDQALLNQIFRAAHTIKGNSAMIGHTRMAALTHAIETRLDDLRKRTASVTPELVEALLRAVDVLKLLRDEVETRIAANVDVDAAARAIERRAGRRGQELAASYRFTIGLDDGPWMAIRALQALLALGEHGQILSSEPSQPEIEREDGPPIRQLVVCLSSEATREMLIDVLSGVPELSAIEAETLTDLAGEPQLDGPTAVGAPAASPRTRPTTIRIDVARLDSLLNLVGELVIDRTQLTRIGNALVDDVGEHRLLNDLQETAVHIGRITDELQEQVMKSRMLPVENVFNRLTRVVRDVAASQGKRIDFVVEGKDTELDRSVIEEIGDPLLHLIRNGIDHGIESPEQRLALGKPATGTLRLTARHADSFILISLEDDGSGIDLAAVKRKAVERGVISADYADRMADADALQLIFAPGLSTAQAVSDLSGRGVGMDVVRSNVEKINGSVDVLTRRGLGTTFTIRLPLTLAIVQALLVRVAGGIFAVPIRSVTETLRIEPHEVRRVNQREAIVVRDRVLPLVSVRRLFGISAGDEPAVEAADGGRLVVAVHTPNRQVGLIVDGLVGEQEIVIKPLSPLVGRVAGVSGAAILGDGSVALIVDVAALIAQAIEDNTTAADEPTLLAPRRFADAA